MSEESNATSTKRTRRESDRNKPKGNAKNESDGISETQRQSKIPLVRIAIKYICMWFWFQQFQFMLSFY